MKIRRGVTRTVLLTKRYAIKVPRLKACNGHRVWTFCRGILANQSEADWSNYENSHGELCPVIKSFLHGLINVYPRAQEFKGDVYAAHAAWEQMRFKTPADVKPHNFGWLNGKLVWLDYDMNYNDCKRCGPEERND